MNTYLMKRDGDITGPFTRKDLCQLHIIPSDLFALLADELVWLPASEIPELRQFFACSEPSTLQLADGRGEKPEKTAFRKKFSESEFRIYFKNFLDTIQTARVSALFVIMMTSALFIKLTLDHIVVQNFTYLQTAIIPPPVAEGYKTGKNIRNALVKSFVDPALSQKKYHKPAKPKDVFKQIQVSGKGYPAKDLQPTFLLITVRNNSPYPVENAEVEVLYETGEKPFIEKYQFNSLSPLGTKTMSVPYTKKKAKVKYRVLNIYTSQYTAFQREV